MGEAARLRQLGSGQIERGLLEVELDWAALINEGEEGQLAHHPPRHHPAGNRHRLVALRTVWQVGVGPLQLGRAVGGLEPKGVGALSQLREGPGFLQTGLAQIRHS